MLLKISQLDLDIIHGFAGGSISTLGLIVARFKKIPFVFSYATRWNRYTHYFFKGRVIDPKMMERASKIFCNRCDCVIAPMPKIKNELISFGIKKPIVEIPVGVEIDRFKNQKKGFLRKKTRIKDEDILLFVGRLGKEKNVDFLLKAFQLIHNKAPQVKLVLVGDGSDKTELIRLAEKLNIKRNVYFTGEIDQSEINKVYADASIFVFASTTETQGMVILEALASGVPVVAVNDSVFNGVVENRVNGILVNNNHDDFANACISLLNDPSYRKKLSINARSTTQKFSVSNSAHQLKKLYEKLILQNNQQNFHGAKSELL